MTEKNEYPVFVVVWATDPFNLGQNVSAYMKSGWVLAGNMCAVYDPKDGQTNYMQPMIHY